MEFYTCGKYSYMSSVVILTLMRGFHDVSCPKKRIERVIIMDY